ncbi:ankyrin repeat-containing domain protein [Aspergillus carlsbadensis]|nr:ankyrin repeat-containing domain protein [Aspergillus carlsbadensis]
MSLCCLPTELLLQIIAFVDSLKALRALTLTNRLFYALADPRLYEQDAQDSQHAIQWAARWGNMDLLRKSLNHGAIVPLVARTFRPGEDDKMQRILEDEAETSHTSVPDPAHIPLREHPLREAVECGRPGIVRVLFDLGCDVYMANHQKLSLLRAAVAYGHTEVVRLLLARGTRQNMGVFHNSESPIDIAAGRGDQEIVEVLLLDPNKPSEDHMKRALESALVSKNFHLVPLLIEDGLNLNFYLRVSNCRVLYTPLLWAAGPAGQVELVRLLLDKGADPEFTHSWDSHPLLIAVRGRSEEIVRLLAPVTHRIFVTRALMLSVEQADGTIAKVLLENGAKPDYEPADSAELSRRAGSECTLGMADELVPPLIAAVSRGHDSLVRLLVEHGTNVNVEYYRDIASMEKNVPEGFMGAPLLLAMKLGFEEIAAFLRENGGREEAGTWEDQMARRFSEEQKEQFMSWSYKRPVYLSKD